MTKGEAIHIVLNTIYGSRIVNGDKWLTIENDVYYVYKRSYGQKKTRVLVITADENEAVKNLTDDSI